MQVIEELAKVRAGLQSIGVLPPSKISVSSGGPMFAFWLTLVTRRLSDSVGSVMPSLTTGTETQA